MSHLWQCRRVMALWAASTAVVVSLLASPAAAGPAPDAGPSSKGLVSAAEILTGKAPRPHVVTSGDATVQGFIQVWCIDGTRIRATNGTVLGLCYWSHHVEAWCVTLDPLSPFFGWIYLTDYTTGVTGLSSWDLIYAYEEDWAYLPECL